VTDVTLFHHAQGLTHGVREFADQLRAACAVCSTSSPTSRSTSVRGDISQGEPLTMLAPPEEQDLCTPQADP